MEYFFFLKEETKTFLIWMSNSTKIEMFILQKVLPLWSASTSFKKVKNLWYNSVLTENNLNNQQVAKMWTQENKYFVQKMCKLFINLLKKHIPDKKESEIIGLVVQHSQKRLNADIDFKKYPELRGMKQLISAECKGISDGAEIDEGYTVIYTNALNFYHRMICTGKIRNIV